jgi:replicative DNA helicase
MAASLEHQVISKIVEHQDFHTIEKVKLDSSFFFSPECRQIFEFLRQHYHAPQTFGSVPSIHLVQQIFPGFQYAPSYDDLQTLCEQVRVAKMRVEITDIAEKIMQLADYNPRAALELVKSSAADLSTKHEVNDDLLLADSFDILKNEYELVASGRGVTGWPWPWDPINEATQGIHNGEFYVIYGRPKNMKTWVALYIATILNMYANARVLIMSNEMPPRRIIRRIAAIRTCVNYKSLLAGKLQPIDRDRFYLDLETLKNDLRTSNGAGPKYPGLLVTSGKGGGISLLHSKIREFKPNFVLVDGMYLMKDDRQNKRTIDWKAVAHISQDLKITAGEFDVPILATAQANRKADKNARNADLEEIAYSDAIAQDTDFSIRVQKRIDKSTKEPEIVMGFPGSRETDLDSILINAIPAINFTFKSSFVTQQDDENDDQNKRSSGNSKVQTVPTIPVGRFKNL